MFATLNSWKGPGMGSLLDVLYVKLLEGSWDGDGFSIALNENIQKNTQGHSEDSAASSESLGLLRYEAYPIPG